MSEWQIAPNIGQIPAEWAWSKFGNICKWSRYGVTAISDEAGQYPMLRMNNMQNGKIDSQDIVYIALSDDEYAMHRLRRGELLVNRTNSYDLVGKTALVEHHEDFVCASYIVRFGLDQDKAEPKFINYFFNSTVGQHYLQVLATKGVSQANINPTTLKEYFVVPLPPMAEQRKIAEILSTWDEAIQLVEALIAALKERKKGLMQRLLTGEVRFPGFDGEWEEVRLGDAFSRITRTVDDDAENVLSITAGLGFVDQSEKFGRVIAGRNLKKYINLRRGEFAYNKGNSTLYPQGCIYRLEEYEQGAVPNVYYCFAPSTPRIVSDFYRHYFESGALNGKLRPLINSGVRNDGLLNLSADAFFTVEVIVPSPDEQHKIASFFDMVTDEIRIQQVYLNHLREQKKGLMQRLLTGEVRVRV